MRHIHVEIAQKESSADQPPQEGDLPRPNIQTGVLDSSSGQGLIRPFSENEIKLQKVYQLSIFSQLAGFTESVGQRAGKHTTKRGLSESPTHSDKKRVHLAQSDEELEDEVGPSDQLVDEKPLLCGSGQHFSHTGMRVIEHKDYISPARDPVWSAGRLPFPLPALDCSKQVLEHNAVRNGEDCNCPRILHSTDCAIQTDPPAFKSMADSRTAGMWELANGEMSCGQTSDNTEHKDFIKRCKSSDEVPAPYRETEDRRSRTLAQELRSPETNQPQASSSNGLASSEKTPCLAKQSGPSPAPGSSGCAVKRKLLVSSDMVESCSEDEGPSTSKKSCTPLSHAITVSCRSTDAKAAPFWNHLLPLARDRPKCSADCSSVGRRLKGGLRLKSRQLRSSRRGESSQAPRSSWSSGSISRSLLGNFEESILKGRFAPSGRIEGFTAEIGASGSYCPQHATLPVEVTYYDISEHSAPSPFLGVIHLESLGKKGYSVPKAGTIQVTLFNPNKTVVKMFLVTYSFGDMPVNHVTFLRHRIFLVPVEEGEEQGGTPTRRRILCYLIHLRFQSSKSGKIYLHNDIRLLFSRKSIEVDTGIPYELKSFTEMPRNPKYSPRV
ncbi:protein FAM214B-like [Polyodon spathula]|uniref:protein FAM214B-like n=1 Tax=Polyodon spathula TaxID=7913 RepID=UPI001B7EA229|nr:protein FAM214B-like [Polyodon spathula]XP_041094368.1 protein FAM214B-like [Polyodon spathula]XP_041094378.1 protein FAM214B-like [Polyodon spathula]XP_041094381.1 protein FAM214B-like [Polyodon spathula]XP_041094382.1 protein FAM214B-like [Polyodon spathula]XP_041094389.1 protein FAM214B-like [Polyodon spathula]